MRSLPPDCRCESLPPSAFFRDGAPASTWRHLGLIVIGLLAASVLTALLP